MDAESVFALISAYVATAVGVFLLYSPVLALFVVLLLAAGVLQLIALPFIMMIRRLRRKKGADSPPDGTWFFR